MTLRCEAQCCVATRCVAGRGGAMRSLTRLLAVARERQDGSNIDHATIPLFDFPSERSAQRFRGIVSD